MLPHSVERGFELLRHHVRTGAVGMLQLDRDESDSFRINVEDHGIGPELTGQSMMPFLPSGSNWQAAVGWRSFFCHRVPLNQRLVWLFGMEAVVAHATRGAYPILEAYLHDDRAALSSRASGLAEELVAQPDSRITSGWIWHRDECYLLSRAHGPDAFGPDEARLLWAMVVELEGNDDILARTLVLSESRLPASQSADAALSLVGLVPPIFRSFSRSTRMKLRLTRADLRAWLAFEDGGEQQ